MSAMEARRARPQGSIDAIVRFLSDPVPGVFAGSGRIARWMFELVMAVQVHDLDAIGVEAFVVDQSLRQHQRLGRPDRLHIDLALQALEAVAVGVAEILVKGDAIIVHLVLPSFPISLSTSLLSGVHVCQTLAVAQHDLTGARKYQDTLVAEL